MTNDGAHEVIKYETKTVKAIRGLEGWTISKWEKEGWEFVSQAQGRIQTEITVRRPVRKLPWRVIGFGGAAVAVIIIVLVVLGVTGVFRSGNTSNAPRHPRRRSRR